MTTKKRALAILLVIVTLFGMFAMFVPMQAEAASLARPVVKYSLKSTKTEVKFGIWHVYEKKATVTWKKVSGADGYEVYVNTNNCSKKTITTTKTSTTMTHCVHGLFASLNIYPYWTVKVRAYDVVNGKNVYGPWSYPKIIWA